jgi:hypothetical protein
MKYYKKIEIENLEVIQKKVLQFIKFKHPTIYFRKVESSWNHLDVPSLLAACPELSESFGKLNLSCIFASIHIMYDNTHSAIHTDITPWKARINIPILNCNGTFTKFYTGEKVVEEIRTMANNKTFKVDAIINPLECIEVDAYELTQPLILKTYIPHRVFMNETSRPRIALSIGCDPDPFYQYFSSDE